MKMKVFKFIASLRVLVSLIIGAAFVIKANHFHTVCRGGVLSLPCPLKPMSSTCIWKYKPEFDSTFQRIGNFSLQKAHLSPNIPDKFTNILTISENGSIAFTHFQTEHSGIYLCLNEKTRIIHVAVAVECERKICAGDEGVIECDMMRHQRLANLQHSLNEVTWKYKLDTVISADKSMSVTYVSSVYKGVSLSESIKGALVVKSVDEKMNGRKLTCFLYGEHGSIRRWSSVMIRTMKCTKTKQSCEGETIGLQCPYYDLLKSKQDVTHIVWSKGSRKIVALSRNGHAILTNLSVSIKVNRSLIELRSVSVSDGGTYTCFVVTKEGDVLAKHSVTLNVTQCSKSVDVLRSTKKTLAIVLPVVLIVLIIIIVAVALFLWRRYNNGNRPPTDKPQSHVEY